MASDLGSESEDTKELYNTLRDYLSSIRALFRSRPYTTYGLGEINRSIRLLSDKFVSDLARFKSSLEFIFEDAVKIGNSKLEPYVEGMKLILNEISYLITSARMERRRFTVEYRTYQDLDNVYEAFRAHRWDNCIKTRGYIQGLMVEFLENFDLIHRLRIFPMERKARIRSKLSDRNYEDVLECLSQADENAIAGPIHYKDCADRCREAFEKLVTHFARETDGKPRSSEANMTHLQGKGLFEVPTKIYMVAFNAFLSQVGPHGLSKKELAEDDVNYILEETYLNLSRILERYDEYMKNTGTRLSSQ